MEKQDFKGWLETKLSHWEWERLSKIFGGVSPKRLSRKLNKVDGWNKEEIKSFIEYMVDSNHYSIDELGAGFYDLLKRFDMKLSITLDEMDLLDKELTKMYSLQNAGNKELHPVCKEFKELKLSA